MILGEKRTQIGDKPPSPRGARRRDAAGVGKTGEHPPLGRSPDELPAADLPGPHVGRHELQGRRRVPSRRQGDQLGDRRIDGIGSGEAFER